MATRTWLGGAPAVAQVQSYTFGGTWEASDIVTLTIGTVTVSVVAGSATTNTVVDNVVTAWNALSASDYPQFAEITASRSGSALVLTADTAGVPFTCTVATTETGGGAADDQTIDGATSSTGTASTANSGPNDWSTAANWSAATVPVDNDDVILDGSNSIYYGLAQSSVEPTTLTIRQTFTGYCGLPKTNSGGYPEYREQYLQLGPTTCTIGLGDGSGSGRIKLDFTTDQTACTVVATGRGAESGIPAVLLKGTNASNTLTVLDGEVGVAYFSDETSTVATLTVMGGTVTSRAGLTTLHLNGGTLRHGGSAAVTTANVNAGTLYYDSTGTATTMNIRGTVDCSEAAGARTFTTTNLYAGATLSDPRNSVTHTNGLIFKSCALADVSLDLGYGRTLTVSA